MTTVRALPRRPLDRTTGDLDLVAAAQAGDEAAFDLLLARYRRFVRARSRNYFLVGGDRDDLEQEALIGFYKSVRDFRVDVSPSFRAFVDLCVSRQIISAIKAATRQKHALLNSSVSLAPANDAGELDREIVDRGADPLEQLLAIERVDATHHALARDLTQLEVEVLGCFVGGATYESIANAVGRDPKAVDNALQRIRRKVSAHLADRVELELVG